MASERTERVEGDTGGEKEGEEEEEEEQLHPLQLYICTSRWSRAGGSHSQTPTTQRPGKHLSAEQPPVFPQPL